MARASRGESKLDSCCMKEKWKEYICGMRLRVSVRVRQNGWNNCWLQEFVCRESACNKNDCNK